MLEESVGSLCMEPSLTTPGEFTIGGFKVSRSEA